MRKIEIRNWTQIQMRKIETTYSQNLQRVEKCKGHSGSYKSQRKIIIKLHLAIVIPHIY